MSPFTQLVVGESVASPAENSSSSWKREPQGVHDFENAWCVGIERPSCDNNEDLWAATWTSSLCWLQISCTNTSPHAERSRCLWSATDDTKLTTEVLLRCIGEHGGGASASSWRTDCLPASIFRKPFIAAKYSIPHARTTNFICWGSSWSTSLMMTTSMPCRSCSMPLETTLNWPATAGSYKNTSSVHLSGDSSRLAWDCCCSWRSRTRTLSYYLETISESFWRAHNVMLTAWRKWCATLETSHYYWVGTCMYCASMEKAHTALQ